MNLSLKLNKVAYNNFTRAVIVREEFKTSDSHGITRPMKTQISQQKRNSTELQYHVELQDHDIITTFDVLLASSKFALMSFADQHTYL